jgi:hypothetical protein
VELGDSLGEVLGDMLGAALGSELGVALGSAQIAIMLKLSTPTDRNPIVNRPVSANHSSGKTSVTLSCTGEILITDIRISPK